MIKNCTRCELSKTRVNVVAGRGSLTSTILIIGEAPGKAEDVVGQSFIGESGKLLAALLQRSGIDPEGCYYTNTVMCRPCDEREGDSREPAQNEVFLCLDNVLSTINSLKHLKGVIFAGSIAKKWYASRLKGIPQVNIMHPALLARQGGPASPHYRDALNALKEFYESVR